MCVCACGMGLFVSVSELTSVLTAGTCLSGGESIVVCVFIFFWLQCVKWRRRHGVFECALHVLLDFVADSSGEKMSERTKTRLIVVLLKKYMAH